MDYNFKRVLVKDYTTIANAVMALLLLQLLESYYFAPAAAFNRELVLTLAIVAALIATTAVISYVKRKKWLRA